MVLFEIAGRPWPLDDNTAERLAAALRLRAKTESGDGAEARLADTLEAVLVGSHHDPIAVDEAVAEALFRQLNLTIRNPDAVEPAYELYLELRRFLGRLYS